jgi:hypothetical protein
MGTLDRSSREATRVRSTRLDVNGMREASALIRRKADCAFRTGDYLTATSLVDEFVVKPCLTRRGPLCKQSEGLTIHAAADFPAIVAEAQCVDGPGRQRFTHQPVVARGIVSTD